MKEVSENTKYKQFKNHDLQTIVVHIESSFIISRNSSIVLCACECVYIIIYCVTILFQQLEGWFDRQ